MRNLQSFELFISLKWICWFPLVAFKIFVFNLWFSAVLYDVLKHSFLCICPIRHCWTFWTCKFTSFTKFVRATSQASKQAWVTGLSLCRGGAREWWGCQNGGRPLFYTYFFSAPFLLFLLSWAILCYLNFPKSPWAPLIFLSVIYVFPHQIRFLSSFLSFLLPFIFKVTDSFVISILILRPSIQLVTFRCYILHF